MTITQDDVTHVARLARLELTPDELSRFTQELSGIISLVEQLNTLDLEALETLNTQQTEEIPTLFREDSANRRFERDALLKNAPQEEDGFFRVPQILQEK